jgi:hypothetical protein
MTNTQKFNLCSLYSFSNNIGKLSKGRSTKFQVVDEDGNVHSLAKVTCDTVGQTPRLFSVSSKSGYLPAGSGYTYKRIMSNLSQNVSWT